VKNKQARIIAISVSFVVHSVFILWAILYHIPFLLNKEDEKPSKFQVKIVKQPQLSLMQTQSRKRITETFRFEVPDNAGTIENFLKEEDIQSKQKEPGLPSLAPELVQAVIPQELYNAQKKKPEYDLPPKKQPRDTKNAQREQFTIVYEDMIKKAEELADQQDNLKDFADRAPGYLPVFTPQRTETFAYQGDMGSKQEPYSIMMRKVEVGDFDEDLLWSLETYQDPKDKKKYFRVKIRAGRKSQNLPTIPKEILFLVDGSKSVEEKRLREFQQGLELSLKQLNEQDYFNIIVFKERIIPFKRGSVHPTEKNLTQAVKFINKFRIGGKTDTFEVLEKSVKRKPKTIPSYILLLSDGRPTKGVTNPRELINKISDYNNGRKPIFAYSGGMGISRYLLDFISFKNRGWTEYSYRTHRIAENLVKMYAKLDEPIIMNLRYYKSGLNEAEMFPKNLSDFFRNAEFTLYGIFDEEKEFVIQLLGDVQGETREFVMRSFFDKANTGKKDIAAQWANNKIYHLISLLKHDDKNEELLAQIDSLSKQFKFNAPYLDDILK